MKTSNYVIALFLVFNLATSPIFAQWVKTNLDSSITGKRCFTTCSNGKGGTNLFVGTLQGVYLSTNNGNSWALQDSAEFGSVRCLVGLDTNLIAVQSGGAISVSTNNGTSWNWRNSIENPYTIAVNGTNIFFGTLDYGIYLSTDMGSSCTQMNNGLANYLVLSFAFIGTNVFAGTEGGVCLSRNNGNTWSFADSGLPNPTGSYIPEISIYSLVANGDNLLARTGGGNVFISTNNGTSWTGLTNISSVTALTAIGGNLFAGTSAGVFLSSNNGTNWISVNFGLTDTGVVDLAVMGTNLYAQTSANVQQSGSSVWMRPLSNMITSIKDVPDETPTHFRLEQNYPNPFNPSTTISFSLSAKSFVSVKLFDLTGKEVTTIVSEELPAGSYSKKWNATSVASGIYFYRFQAGLYTETKKLVLLK